MQINQTDAIASPSTNPCVSEWVSGPVTVSDFGDSYRIYQACQLVSKAFFHHYQGSIDFNTVNIHRTAGMYFFVSTGNRGDIE